VRPILGRITIVLVDLWGVVKFVGGFVLSPIILPIVAWRAAINFSLAKSRVATFCHQIRALDSGLAPSPPFDRVDRIDANQDVFISSDLHRCYPGRRDWLRVQDVKELYAAMLDHYGNSDAHLVENGDIEDFWMVGGSPYGQAWDFVRATLLLLPGRGGLELRRALVRQHLRRIVANNLISYLKIARHFAPRGRYHRIVGNHDDVFLDPALSKELSTHLGGVRPTDWVVLENPDGSAAAVITHGHQTDGWNSPGRANLGKFATWIGNTISDTPGLEAPESISPRSLTLDLLEGRLSNHLLTVGNTFGTNTGYDSLDEERLFDTIGGATDAGPWLILGHTHLPVFQPLSRTKVPWYRYANSGNGIWNGMITGVEWDGETRRPRVVAWLWADQSDTAHLTEDNVVHHRNGRPVARIALEPDPTGRHLRAPATPTSPATPVLGEPNRQN
jgi:hypothetical protein